jgi:hypothetical protein
MLRGFSLSPMTTDVPYHVYIIQNPAGRHYIGLSEDVQ